MTICNENVNYYCLFTLTNVLFYMKHKKSTILIMEKSTYVFKPDCFCSCPLMC